MRLRVTKIRPQAVIPAYATPGSAAFDLTAAETTEIPPKGQGLVPIGLVFAVPEGHVLHIFARSSTFGKLGLMLANGVGVIDSDYRGTGDEVRVIMYNPGDAAVTVAAGTRVAQAIVYPVPRIEFDEGPVEGPSRGGIGSTGGYGESV
jgi:dUTP pyrophosphatase